MQASKPITANSVSGLGGYPHVAHALERRPGGIDDEGGKAEKDEQRLHPPRVGAHRLAKPPLRRQRVCIIHQRT